MASNSPKRKLLTLAEKMKVVQLIKEGDSDTDGSDIEQDEEEMPCSIRDAQEYLNKLKKFSQVTGTSDLLSHIMNASDIVNEMSVNVVITDYFK